MRKYSVWYMPYSRRYLLTHPWQWFKCAWRCLKDAWRRSVYGWTYGDVWDWFEWFTRTTPNMLRYMAKHGSAYPGYKPFDTPESWHIWLNQMADLIESADEKWQEEHNEYSRDYFNNISGIITTSADSELKRKYLDRAKELQEMGEKNIQQALQEIGEFFYMIWD